MSAGAQSPARISYRWELLLLLWGAFCLHQGDRQIFGWVAEGQTIHQITEKGGYF